MKNIKTICFLIAGMVFSNLSCASDTEDFDALALTTMKNVIKEKELGESMLYKDISSLNEGVSEAAETNKKIKESFEKITKKILEDTRNKFFMKPLIDVFKLFTKKSLEKIAITCSEYLTLKSDVSPITPLLWSFCETIKEEKKINLYYKFRININLLACDAVKKLSIPTTNFFLLKGANKDFRDLDGSLFHRILPNRGEEFTEECYNLVSFLLFTHKVNPNIEDYNKYKVLGRVMYFYSDSKSEYKTKIIDILKKNGAEEF